MNEDIRSVLMDKPAFGRRANRRMGLNVHTLSGLLLLLSAIAALIVANVPALGSINDFLSTMGGIEVGNFSLKMSVRDWVNDGLMAIFFLLVGLEIKREMLVGELSHPKQAMLPIFAAVGGMLFPALIYTLFNYGSAGQNGWGIPMATDIAFAVGVISLLGRRCPLSLKVFLMALAVVDDLGSIIVLAIFYPSHAISLPYLLIVVGIVLVLLFFNYKKVRSAWAYIVPGLFMWYFMYRSGIHATISGVILAALIPSKTSINEVRFQVRIGYLLEKFKSVSNCEIETLANSNQQEIIHKMNIDIDKMTPLVHLFEFKLRPIIDWFIMPVFAFANAGVALHGIFGGGGGISTISFGIFFGLLLGKPLGIFAASYISVKTGIAELPLGMKWKQLLAVGVVAGIGFTMSIFIDNLAFSDMRLVNIGKATILLTSLAAALLGLLAIYLTTPPVTRYKKPHDK